MVKLWSLLVLISTAACQHVAQPEVPEPPVLDPDEWWGPEDTRYTCNTTIRPFTVKFLPEMINDLKSRLRNHRALVPPLRGVGFQYGFNQQQIDPWVQYWTEQYDFKQREKFLNKFPQYKTNIQGLDIHFIWVKCGRMPAGVTCVPLLLMHSWPGSVREFYEAIPHLTTPRDGIVFEVIAPSMPGFGFSDGAVRPGLGSAQIGVIFKNLMNRLGYRKFYIQGGNWGAVIGNAMATMFQKEMLGLHSNMLILLENNCVELQTLISGVMAAMQLKSHEFDQMSALIVEETGYIHLFATKPDTVGIGLSDSPVGLMAFILEKFSTWTHIEDRSLKDGGLSLHFTRDQLIDNLMIYWITNCISTSFRLYAEAFSNAYRALRIDDFPTVVPIWKLEAINEELFVQPVNKKKYPNLLKITKTAFGGHFFAFEMPKFFARDVFKAVIAFRKFHEDNKICKF
ncbi:juvenile hormone epoxide hydrolase-like [Bicyclus anynana]|uniref:Epoxide hydrolase n=1 Tax=Bicyclus anynana TaxID=110368 RepID=A0A6J1N120_BICAN|nr:juvenile hormone epoxide hydrolase-like [Bicyclus anynana]